MKRFKPQNSYLIMTENISYLAKKSFSTKMIKDDPIVYIPSYSERKRLKNNGTEP